MLTSVLQVLAAAAVAAYVTGSEITLQSSASAIKPLISSNFTLVCALHDTTQAGPAVGKRAVSWSNDDTTELDNFRGDAAFDSADDENTVTQTSDNVQFVTSMVVSRDGVDIATMTEHFGVKQLVSGFTVTGHLTRGAGERGKMTLTWPHPTQADIGTYRCDFDTLSAQGHPIVFSKTVEVTGQEVSINDLVSKLHTVEIEKEAMQREIETMKESEIKLKDDMQIKINALESQSLAQNKSLVEIKNSENQLKNKMQLEINSLKLNNSALSKDLDSLRAIARVEPKVFFSAILSTSTTFQKNENIVYDKVITNEGSAYNNRNGKFTCQTSGFYHFELHVYCGTHYAYLVLRKNGNVVISAHKYGDNETGASNSVTLKLSSGDVIDVIDANGGTVLAYGSPYYIQNSFSGRLIALL